MSDLKKTAHKGLSIPDHNDPSLKLLSENMEIIDDFLNRVIPDGGGENGYTDFERDFDSITETKVCFVLANAAHAPMNLEEADVYTCLTFVTSANPPTMTQFAIPHTISSMPCPIHWRSVKASNKTWIFNGRSVPWRKMWDSETDGMVSGLDADLWDGHEYKELVDSLSRVQRVSFVIPVSGWVDSKREEYIYTNTVQLVGVTEHQYPITNIYPDDMPKAVDAGVAPWAETKQSAIQFWSRQLPSEDIHVDVVLFTESAEGIGILGIIDGNEVKY